MNVAMPFYQPVSILGLTIALALIRPKFASVRINLAGSALIGAALALLSGTVPLDLALVTLRRLGSPLLTIISLMTLTQVAARVGLLHLLSGRLAIAAQGDGRRLFSYIFWSGALVGALFTNDAAILLFTPMVLVMMETIDQPDWSDEARLPFYFSVLYIGNLVGALVISNPINIIAASFFDIGFMEYFRWMLLPALVSMAISWAGLRFAFRNLIPRRCGIPSRTSDPSANPGLQRSTSLALVVTLLGFMTEGFTGIPTSAVAAIGAGGLLILLAARGISPFPVLARLDWQVLIFVSGIMIITIGLRNAGITHILGNIIQRMSSTGLPSTLIATSLLAAGSSAFINNHSTVGLMIWVIRDFHLDELGTKLMVYAALIGGDLGPKMLPVGSLAALMWFRMMHLRGIKVSVLRYIALGIPITLAAVLASVGTLVLEWWLVQLSANA